MTVRTAALKRNFFDALGKLWRTGGRPERLGIAISGGVDSMALANLCSEYRQLQNSGVAFTGYVVDHKLRVESTLEAVQVANRLSSLSIEPRILTLDWGDYGNASDVPNLESVARRLRYQALGQACAEHGIHQLLVAHHRDDQAETVLARIIGKFYGSGLQGIQVEKPIPECQGMYGVHESGQPHPVAGDGDGMMIESGGVSIVRPLLSASKDDLQTYCLESNVEWFEDKTNKDPTFTLRNTIRYALRHGLLPIALRQESLCSLADTIGASELGAAEQANDYFNALPMRLDLATATVSLVIAEDVKRRIQSSDGTVRTQQLVVRNLLGLISPITQWKPSSVDMLAHCIFVSGGAEMERPVAGVTVKRSPDCPSTLTIVRQRPTRQEVASCNHVFRFDKEEIEGFDTTDWHLWDNRWWIRMHRVKSLHDNTHMVLRFLSNNETPTLNGPEYGKSLKVKDSLVDEAAPGLKYTLPAVVQYSLPELQHPSFWRLGQVVALPSLGWFSNCCQRWPESAEKARNFYAVQHFWEIRYKKIEIGNGRHHSVVPR